MSDKQLPRKETCNIAIPFNRKPEEGELQKWIDAGADIFEVRLDLCDCKSALQAMSIAKKFKDFPSIVTCRSAAEGGKDIADNDRLHFFQQASDFATAVDIELSSTEIIDKVMNVASNAGCETIISYHNVEGTPPKDELLKIFESAKSKNPQIVKIATLVREIEEADRLVDVLESNDNSDLKFSVIAMGENDIAKEARIELGKRGSFFTFAANADFSSAPGQPQLEALVAALSEEDLAF